MSKLIDTEKLARLAKALDDRAKAAVAAEEQRARAAEEAIDAKANANAAAIEAINHTENGILAQAKAFVNEEIGKVNEAMEEADNGLSERLDVLEGMVTGDENGLGKMQESIAANKAAIDKLNGGVDEEGSVAKAIKDAVDPVQGEVDALEAVVGKAAEGEKAATGMFKYIDAQDAAKLQEAKNYADQKITALVDSAPDAMNTLNELASAINAHQDVYNAYVGEISAELAKKVDKVEGSRLIAETEAAAFAAKAEVADVEQCLADAKTYADGKVAVVQGEVDAVEGRMDAAEGRLNALEAEQDTQDAAIKAAQDAADKAQGEVDAVEGRMDAVEAEQLTQNQGIADNKAAIDKLNGGADEEGSVAKSIADALEPYSTTEEMKVILGNVVNSLALTMENDKVVLKLGGVEGVAITEVSLDMATDADIDAIVAGLDAE